MELKDLANKFKANLSGIYDENEVDALFLLAIEQVLGFHKSDYLFKKDQIIAAKEMQRLQTILAELSTGKPIQYILGEAPFYGLQFKVNASVLIPRPETEELVDWILSVYRSSFTLNDQKLSILDIGTGSGCIAIALKKHLPHVQVKALDIAEDSLALAQENALANQVEVAFIHDDILNPSPSTFKLQPSLIVSNPPYIKEAEKTAMHANVLAHEPHRALFVSNDNPLVFYEAIAEFAFQTLPANGLLFFEINAALGQQTVDLLNDKGFINIELRKDMQENDRMICCVKP